MADPARRFSLWRILPLTALVAGLVAFFAFGLADYVNFETLARERGRLQDCVSRWPIGAPLAYAALYATAVAFSLPVGAFTTILGGFLFGTWLGTALAMAGATLGAVVLFVAARTALGSGLRAKAAGPLARMEAGFRANAFNYLLVLRLVPLFPFFVVNIVPALVGIPLRTFVAATVIGIVPGTLVYAGLGNGLDEVIAQGRRPDLGIIFDPSVLLPLLGLAAFALLPVFVKALRARQSPP